MNKSLQREITLRSVLKFTFPSIIMMTVMSLYTIVDGMFVSRLIGTDAFSAVNIVYPLISIIVGLGAMFGTGVTAIVSMKLGEGKRDQANSILSFVILFTIVLGIILAMASFIFLDKIIYLLGANESVYEYCYAYAFPLIFFFPANILQCQFQSLYVAEGRPGIGLIMTIIGGVSNMVLDYVFISYCGMGIAGAAVATGIGYSIPALFGICYFFLNRKGNLCYVRPKAEWRMLLNSATNGSSEMVSFLSTSITTFLFNIITMRLLGQDGVAAIAILLYFDFLLVAVGVGYSMGVAPLISYNYGKGDNLKLKKIYKLSLGFCVVVGVLTTLITVIFSEQLCAVFAHKGSVVYTLAVTGLRIYAFNYLFKGYNIFASSMFTAFGDGRISAILSFLRTLVFLVISMVGLSALFGMDGIWFSSPCAEILAVSVAIFYTVKYRKKYNYLS